MRSLPQHSISGSRYAQRGVWPDGYGEPGPMHKGGVWPNGYGEPGPTVSLNCTGEGRMKEGILLNHNGSCANSQPFHHHLPRSLVSIQNSSHLV